MRDLKLKWVWFILGITAVIAVFYLSLRPVPEFIAAGDAVFTPLDKVLHLTCYASLCFGFTQLFKPKYLFRLTNVFIAMGALIEFLQGQVVHRSFENSDLVANALGAVIGAGISKSIIKDLIGSIERKLFFKKS